MYEKLIERLREYPDREETAGGYVEVDWQDLLDAADALESLTAQLAALQSENAEKGMEIERLKSELLEAREDYMASEMEREQGVNALACMKVERDTAQKCIYDVETYLELGSGAYIAKTIQAWKNGAQGEG